MGKSVIGRASGPRRASSCRPIRFIGSASPPWRSSRMRCGASRSGASGPRTSPRCCKDSARARAPPSGPGGDDRLRDQRARAGERGVAPVVRDAAAGARRGAALPGLSRAAERRRVGPAGRGWQSPGRLSPQYVRSRAQVPGRSRAAHVSRDNPGPPPPGDDRAGARRRDPGDRALLLVARVRRGVGRVRRAARRRDGVVLVGHGAARRRRRHHPVRGAARRRHRDQRPRLDARAGDRLHPRPHAGTAAPGRGARGPLSGVAGAGVGLCAGAARDPAPARRGRKRAGREVRHSHVPRSSAGRRCGASPHVARENRAMDRGCAVALLAALLGASLSAQRQPVLKQVDVPHAYYWREMYVPQVTSGPSAAAWSPDGRELIYAMQGSLWRQRLGSGVAQQVTAGPRYDYQPDWSPDGRFVVYASYVKDAIELQLLDLASGATRPLTANGAVNLEPRWSPDGTRIAFVSTSYNQRWHIFTLALRGAEPGALERVTDDHDSRLPRYYYSRWDHYLSPTWSPDGGEIIFVSNRGHIHGTGGFWRMAARPGGVAAARELRYERSEEHTSELQSRLHL